LTSPPRAIGVVRRRLPSRLLDAIRRKA